MKKFIFLFIVIELACATQAFAQNVRNEAINEDSRKIVTFTESSIAKNDVDALNSVSRSDAGIHAPHATNSIRVSVPVSIKPKKSLMTPHDETAISGVQSVDLSEPSSIILLGVGFVIAIVAKWRKSLKLSLQSNKKTPLTTMTRTSATMQTERRIRKTERIRAGFNSELSASKNQSKHTITV